MAKSKSLVIVESPAKAKTLEKYLGSGFKVVASMGHLRDLPKSKMGVDIENGFEPKYIPVRDKKELIAELKKEAKGAGPWGVVGGLQGVKAGRVRGALSQTAWV